MGHSSSSGSDRITSYICLNKEIEDIHYDRCFSE